MNVNHGMLQIINDEIWDDFRRHFWMDHAVPLVCVGMGTEPGRDRATIAVANGTDLGELIDTLEATAAALKERAGR